MEVPKNLKMELLYDPAISLLGIHLEKTINQKDTLVFITHTHTHTHIYNGILLYILYGKLYIPLYMHNGILLSHKKNDIMPFTATWMDLEIIILKSDRERQI